MTQWNLSKLSELQDRVTEPFAMRTRKRQHSNGVTGHVSRVAVAVAAVTMLTLSAGYTNAVDLHVPMSIVAITTDIAVASPPLDSVFADKFDAQWLQEEERLLARITHVGEPTKEELLRQTVESVFYNLQEDVSTDGHRLSKTEIEKILKQKKLV